MPPEIAISVKNLSKVYKLYLSPIDRLKESLHPLRRQFHHDFYALDDICLEIEKGESVGIIGKNGSGKSTLLKVLAGVLLPTTGSVAVNGKVSSLLELGAGFNPELTGIDNVYFNGMLIGYTREQMDQRLDEIIAFANIGEFIRQPVKTYSSGMFVRLAFAVAVNVEPEILIVDEALAVGDLRFQKKCREKLDEIKKRGVTVIIVSHSMSDIRTLCTKALFMQKGRVLHFGDPYEVINQYIEVLNLEDAHEQLQIRAAAHLIPTTYGGDIAGTEDIVLRNLHCFQKGNNSDNPHVEFGANLIIEFEYEVFANINNPIFTINIGSANYKIIANISSINHYFRISEIAGVGKVRVELTNQQFYPGVYIVHMAVTKENVNSHLYMHNNAGSFIIMPPKDRLLCYPSALVQPEATFSVKGY